MKKVLVRGPALTRTGYGEHTRFVMRALRQVENQYDLYLLPVPWGQSNWIWEDDEERRWLDSIVGKTINYQKETGGLNGFDVSIQVTIPNEWQKMAPINIGVTAGIETTMVSPEWLHKSMEMDKIVVVSKHAKDVFNNTVYEVTHNQTGQKATLRNQTPIDIVHYPTKSYKNVDLGLDLSTDFNFLTVAQVGPRKNLANTVMWFVEEFIDNPDVGLVIKAFKKGGSLMDKREVSSELKHMLSKYKNRKCKIYLLHGDMSEQEMHSLYSDPKIKALVSLSHGEGYGLPHFEAAYSGLPVIAPEYGGYVDFLAMPVKSKKGKREKIKPFFARVDYELKKVNPESVWEGVVHADSMWCYPEQGSYKMRLREVYKDHGRFLKQAKTLQAWVLENFSSKKIISEMLEATVPVFGPSVEDYEKINDMFDDLMAKNK